MTYEELCSFEVLYKAYLEARKGKRSKSKTIEYESHALACTEKLSRKLAVCNVRQPDGSIRQQIRYVPSKFEVFAVYEPKRRMVHAPAFVDKVVLHALVDNILYDALTKSFIRDSHASQTGKGTDDGLMRLKTHMVDYYRREGHGADGWVLKGDVRHFFASIDHRKLKRKLKAVLDKRRETADKQIADAEAAKSEAAAIKQTYEENMRQAKTKADDMILSAQKTAAQRSEEIISQAQKQAAQIKTKAASDIEMEKKKAINEAKNEISELAMAIAGKVVARELNDADQDGMIDRFIEELGDQK